MTLRVLVELSPSLKTDEWGRLHAQGIVPDRLPYGLNWLEGDNLTVLTRTPPRSFLISRLSGVGARLTGGVKWPESALGRPHPAAADIRLCWDERAGIPAILLQSGKRRRQPVVTGVIWNTEPVANLSAFALWLSKKAMRRADAVFVNAAPQARVLREEWGVPSSRVHFVPFGIDTDFWDPAAPAAAEPLELLTEPGQTIVMSVGNDRHRDHGLLLQAMDQVHAKLPDVRLELVTSRPQVIPQEIGGWRRSLTHPQLRDLHRRSQVVAIATRHNIHLSGLTATLESMAMGKPVVATHTPGFEDYIENGKTGILVPPGDPDAMAGALIELAADPDRCQRIGAAARESVLRNFSTRAMCRALARIIRSVS
jgi:glycosyltransferase involved in cell wall biosynthesis